MRSGWMLCDCAYIDKDVATEEEVQSFNDDMKNEAKRGGVIL